MGPNLWAWAYWLGRVSAITPVFAGRNPELTFERTIECCLGFVTDFGSDFGDASRCRLQRSRRKLKSPPHEISDGWFGKISRKSLPIDCGGLLVSGGNMANFTCFMAARAAIGGWDVRTQGVGNGPRLCLYASTETHTWLQKAADPAGLGTDAIHWIEGKQTMDMDQLEIRYRQDIDEGYRPFLVVDSVGTVSTGVVDPLPGLAAFCKERNLWFHVDA